MKYPKVWALGKPETADILLPNALVEITEKLDGANMRVWMQDGALWVGSRNHDFKVDGSTGEFMGGMAGWARDNATELKTFLTLNPNIMVVGEWMQRHTLNYEIKEPYMITYDFLDTTTERPLGITSRAGLLEQFPLSKVVPLHVGLLPSGQELDRMINEPSFINPKVQREGIVIKTSEGVYGKLVRPEFKESMIPTKREPKEFPKAEAELAENVATEARVRKLWLSSTERGHEPSWGMEDMKFLPKDVLDDIMAEELPGGLPEGVDENKFRKFVSNYTARHMKTVMMQKALAGQQS